MLAKFKGNCDLMQSKLQEMVSEEEQIKNELEQYKNKEKQNLKALEQLKELNN